VLGLVARLERQRLLHHAHFSAFQPVAGTPFENLAPTPAAREARLYQAEHLLRDYGFGFEELAFGADGNLPLEHDPKTTWALANAERFPLDVTRAPLEMLLRVPGIGPRAARRIVAERATSLPRDLRDLGRLGVVTTRAAGFLTVGGRRLADVRWAEQMGFWGPDQDVGRYHAVYEVSPGTFR
jgi:predicted DNA-binding helix-hairpin-helix protein